MLLPEQVIESARRWIGTPYQHQGRLLGVGVDCLGLIIGVTTDLGLIDPSLLDYGDYARVPDGDFLQTEIAKFCTQIDLPDPGQPLPTGLLVLFRFRGDPQHCGISSHYGAVIHSHQGAGKVCEHNLDAKWRRRVVAIYQLPGVTYG